ncbi:MAG TPA: hypothetical protein VGO47_01050 [Chlamydiales bacterium]|nr:hypothetical protein [Chlamydiales bacterium]
MSSIILDLHACTASLPLGQRAQAMLKEVLLRRNKDTTVEGRRILELPPKSVEVVEIEFSAEERRVSFLLFFFFPHDSGNGKINQQLLKILMYLHMTDL